MQNGVTRSVIKDAAKDALGVAIGTSKTHTARRESWWLCEEGNEEERLRAQERYKEAKRQAKKVIAQAKEKAYEDLYKKLDSKEGANDIFRIAKALESRRDGHDSTKRVWAPTQTTTSQNANYSVVQQAEVRSCLTGKMVDISRSLRYDWSGIVIPNSCHDVAVFDLLKEQLLETALNLHGSLACGLGIPSNHTLRFSCLFICIRAGLLLGQFVVAALTLNDVPALNRRLFAEARRELTFERYSMSGIHLDLHLSVPLFLAFSRVTVSSPIGANYVARIEVSLWDSPYKTRASA
ncbi:hypothetical protein Tco_0740542 [Tanacetum coccineum]